MCGPARATSCWGRRVCAPAPSPGGEAPPLSPRTSQAALTARLSVRTRKIRARTRARCSNSQFAPSDPLARPASHAGLVGAIWWWAAPRWWLARPQPRPLRASSSARASVPPSPLCFASCCCSLSTAGATLQAHCGCRARHRALRRCGGLACMFTTCQSTWWSPAQAGPVETCSYTSSAPPTMSLTRKRQICSGALHLPVVRCSFAAPQCERAVSCLCAG